MKKNDPMLIPSRRLSVKICLGLVLGCTALASAYLPLHEARVSFFPRPIPTKGFQFGSGALWTTEGLESIPVRFNGNFNNSLEGGLRLNLERRGPEWKTSTIATGLVVGVGGKLRNGGQIEAHALMDLGGKGAPEGAALSYTQFAGNKDLGLGAQLQVGFGQMTGDELAFIEIGAYPWYRLFPELDLVTELTFGTSLSSPADFAALDLAPGMRWRLGGGWTALGTAALGVKGPLKEGPVLWKTVLVRSF
jgi:hypothetical protein